MPPTPLAGRDRRLEGEWPYLWLDATNLRQREGGRIVSVAAIFAVAVNTEGRREIVGLHIGPSEAESFWADFLKSLIKRGGLRGQPAPPQADRDDLRLGKENGGMQRILLRGLARAGGAFALHAAACNLVQLPKPLTAAA